MTKCPTTFGMTNAPPMTKERQAARVSHSDFGFRYSLVICGAFVIPFARFLSSPLDRASIAGKLGGRHALSSPAEVLP